MQSLETTQLERMIDNNEDFLLVNTLSEEDFAQTEIPGSVNIPQNDADFADNVESTAGGKDKPIVVYCASQQCQSSTKAAEKLERAGFETVYDYEGGAKAWTESGNVLAVPEEVERT